MKFKILAIGKKRPTWIEDTFEDYKKRFDRSIKVEWYGLQSVKNIKTLNKATIIKKESEKLLSFVNEGEIIISLDKKGKNWTTLELKEKFDRWLYSSIDVNFLIGGANGLSANCLKKSKEVWSLSSLTFPHAFIPILIIEQLYRVWSIRENHPYHRQ